MGDNPEGPNNWRDHCARLEGRIGTLETDARHWESKFSHCQRNYIKLKAERDEARADATENLNDLHRATQNLVRLSKAIEDARRELVNGYGTRAVADAVNILSEVLKDE